MVKAIIVREFGNSDVLIFDHYEPGRPADNEVRIKHIACGVNYIDTYFRSGLYPVELPFIPGVEAVGIIEETGVNVSGFRVGERVAYATVNSGGYTETRNIDSELVISLPDDLSAQHIAATLMRGMTAEYLLFRCHRLKAGQTILVHAATGALGSILCQWAKHIGATVIGTVGDTAKARVAESNGCDHVIVYSEESVSNKVEKFTRGELLDVVYDGIGKATLHESLHSVKPRGLVISFGNASGAPDPLDVLELARQGSVYLTRPRLADYMACRSDIVTSAERYFKVIRNQQVSLPKLLELPLAEAKQAHDHLQDRTKTMVPVLIPEG